MPAAQRPRSYAGIFLFLYVFTCGGAARAAAQAQSPEEKFGAYLVPLTFLALGVYTAFKSGGRVAKTFASLFVGVLLAAFGVGLLQGYEEHRVPDEVTSELGDLRAGFGLEFTDDEDAADAARRITDRHRQAAKRLQASDDPKAVDTGRALQILSELGSEPDERFIAAFEALELERLLDLQDMVTGREFEWRRTVLAEYAAAAEDAHEKHGQVPARAQQLLQREGIDNNLADSMLEGARKVQPYLLKVWSEHTAVADAYLAIVEHIARNCERIEVLPDGRCLFAEDEAYEEFQRATADAMAAEERLQAAVSMLQTVQQG